MDGISCFRVLVAIFVVSLHICIINAHVYIYASHGKQTKHLIPWPNYFLCYMCLLPESTCLYFCNLIGNRRST
ncbi:hypothetical protein BDA96_05G046400 [Sorghum bicolor]|uniref:Uncharacterized protein n=1 Tax=Sorghum bicolor TaxID=4558 RepID=A0A921QX71_SORBI|nr:hypothetical protein BDA96_05G046400 [Sorghum bicolor]